MTTGFESKKRVLVIDDSVFARKIISDILGGSPDLEVVATASSGAEALSLVKKLAPDVITLDIEMPGLDGLETLRRLMIEHPTPVVMLSSLTVQGAKESVRALTLGAVDVMAKPRGSHSIGLSEQGAELIAKVLAAAHVKPVHLQPVHPKPIEEAPVQSRPSPPPKPRIHSSFPVVIIASSTGGPRALRKIVPDLTSIAGAAYIIVQHLPEGFSGPLSHDLDRICPLNVREAFHGDVLSPGDVIFAKAGCHNVVGSGGRFKLTLDPPLWGVRPSADVTMASAVPVFGSRLIGVILTGMGRDGADGLRLIKNAGGSTIAEHESSCVVYGMPRVAVESGVVDVIAPLDRMAETINSSLARV